MARIRSLKPEAFTSETLALISVEAERTFFGLSTLADDRGRFRDQPAAINGALWPERRSHTAEDVEAELAAMESVGLICRYVGCDGKQYAHSITWDRHQKVDKPSKSRFPRCPLHTVSSEGKAEECGRHGAAACPDSRESRESSRTLARTREGSPNVAGVSGTALEPSGASVRETLASPREDSPTSPDLHSREPREGSRALDTGSRTLDRGSRTLDLKEDADTPPSDEDDGGVLVNLPQRPKTGRTRKPPTRPTDPAADEIAEAWWGRYKATTGQQFMAVRSQVRGTAANGADPKVLAAALELLGQRGQPVSGGWLTSAMAEARRASGGQPTSVNDIPEEEHYDGRFA